MLISPIAAYIPEQPPLPKPSEYGDAEVYEGQQNHYANFFGRDEGNDGENDNPTANTSSIERNML
jgi:hypothetical protein